MASELGLSTVTPHCPQGASRTLTKVSILQEPASGKHREDHISYLQLEASPHLPLHIP